MSKLGPVVLVCLTAAGCGTVSSGQPDARAVDASAQADARPVDAVPPACDLAKPFGDIRVVPGVNTANGEDGVSLSPDELTIYFASNRNDPGTPDYDIFVASRATVNADFGAASPITAVNTGSDDRDPSISSDGLSLFFHSSRNAAADSYDLFVSTRTNTGTSFGAATPLGSDINTATVETAPFVTADGQSLYFNRDAGTGTYSILRAGLGATGFSNPVKLTELEPAGEGAYSPALSADGLTMFFASDRAGGAGSGDIWMATRTTPTGTFGSITNVAELNTASPEYPTWLSPDGCRLYFWSDRAGGAGDFDIWQATRPQ
jgi:Tol biopolymer transport system component